MKTRMKTDRWNRCLLVIMICLLPLSIYQCESDKATSKMPTVTVSHDLTSLAEKNKVILFDKKEKATPFKLKTLSGKTVQLSDYKGKVIFLNFWATWCLPCLKEMPSMEKLHNAMKGKDFVMLTINLDDKVKVVPEYVKRLKVTFSVLLRDNEVASNYRIGAIPVTYIIGKDGIIIGKVIRSQDWSSADSINYFSLLAKSWVFRLYEILTPCSKKPRLLLSTS